LQAAALVVAVAAVLAVLLLGLYHLHRVRELLRLVLVVLVGGQLTQVEKAVTVRLVLFLRLVAAAAVGVKLPPGTTVIPAVPVGALVTHQLTGPPLVALEHLVKVMLAVLAASA
jgi:hypothetical protein